MGDITALLGRARRGENGARDLLFQQLYRELHGLARARMAQEASPCELETTGLLHETYLRLRGTTPLPDGDRRAFFAFAAHVMRNIVVDHARQRRAAKRGGGDAPLTLRTRDAGSVATHPEAEALDAALQDLRKLDRRCHDVVELRYFGGMELAEIGDVLGLSLATVKRDWQKARAFLYRALS